MQSPGFYEQNKNEIPQALTEREEHYNSLTVPTSQNKERKQGAQKRTKTV